MVSSLCPGCGEHAINLITQRCEKCGDKWSGVWEHLKILQKLHAEMGPLRDALTIMVAENFVEYPRGCTCTETDTTPPGEKHTETCPASKYGERYIEHIYRKQQEREAQAQAEENIEAHAEALRRAKPYTDDDVKFVAELREKLHGGTDVEGEVVTLTPEQLQAMGEKLDAAGFTKEWADNLGKLNPEQQQRFIDYAIEKSVLLDHVDIRQLCPECGKAMQPDGVHVVCEPCGVRLIADVTDAVAPGEGEVEVWHCPICDQCYTFRRLDLFPDAIVLAGDPVAPTDCFDCGAKLMQWACYRPFSAHQAFKLAGRALDGSLLPRMDGEAKRRFAADPDEPDLTMDKVRDAVKAMPRDPRGPFPHLAEAERDLLGPAADPDQTDPELIDEHLRGRFGSKGDPEHVSGPEDARVTFGTKDEEPN
jgi:hypothetical protein